MTKNKPTGGNCKGTIVKHNGLLHAKTTCMIDAKLYGRMGGKPKVDGEKATRKSSTGHEIAGVHIPDKFYPYVKTEVGNCPSGKEKKKCVKGILKGWQESAKKDREEKKESEGKSGYSAEGREAPADIYS